LNAFLLPRGAPDPGAPPCILQRFLPRTAGAKQGFPERVFAPQRGLESIGRVLRGWLVVILLSYAAGNPRARRFADNLGRGCRASAKASISRLRFFKPESRSG